MVIDGHKCSRPKGRSRTPHRHGVTDAGARSGAPRCHRAPRPPASGSSATCHDGAARRHFGLLGGHAEIVYEGGRVPAGTARPRGGASCSRRRERFCGPHPQLLRGGVAQRASTCLRARDIQSHKGAVLGEETCRTGFRLGRRCRPRGSYAPRRLEIDTRAPRPRGRRLADHFYGAQVLQDSSTGSAVQERWATRRHAGRRVRLARGRASRRARRGPPPVCRARSCAVEQPPGAVRASTSDSPGRRARGFAELPNRESMTERRWVDCAAWPRADHRRPHGCGADETAAQPARSHADHARAQ